MTKILHEAYVLEPKLPMHAVPFLKWAGSKRQLIPELHKALPKSFGRYWEPFLGGGAFFFHLKTSGLLKHGATLGDSNRDLIRTYRAIQKNVEKVIFNLKAYGPADKEEFLNARKADTAEWEDYEAAARFIYLNRCAFNGLYRVNRSGVFNVPFGKWKTPPTICQEEALRAASAALRGANIYCYDYGKSMAGVNRGDLAFFDPPYLPASNTANFTSYTRDGFTLQNQKELCSFVRWLRDDRGVHVIVSSPDHPLIRKMYRGFSIRRVEARRAINSRADGRGAVGEVIITP